VLWDEGRAVCAKCLRRSRRSRMVAYTTVQTMLTRLAQKGFVRADKSGRRSLGATISGRDQRSDTKALDHCMRSGGNGAATAQDRAAAAR